MYITKIYLENIKKIDKLEHEFVKAVYLIKGKNELGKSTLIQTIMMLLDGQRTADIIQNGKENGVAVMEVGDKNGTKYKVRFSATKANPRGTISIENSDGMKSTNISALQKIFNYCDIDVSEFVSWSKTAEGRRKQVKIVRELLSDGDNKKIDEIDGKYKTLYDERAEINALVNTYEKSLKKDADKESKLETYKDKKDINSLMQKKNEALTKNSEYEKAVELKKDIDTALENFDKETEKQRGDIKKDVDNYKTQVTELQAEIDKKLKDLETRKNELKEKEGKLKNLDDKRATEKEILEHRQLEAVVYFQKNDNVNVEVIENKIQEAIAHNEKHEKAKDYFKTKNQLIRQRNKATKKDEDMKQLVRDKNEIIENSKLPIKGLSFTEEGLYYKGIPYERNKVSTSEEMEVATRIIIAKNPNVKVFKIMRGESLDEDKLKAIIKFAEREGYQGFIEEVERGTTEIKIEEYSEK